jgi:hypothetical protein
VNNTTFGAATELVDYRKEASNRFFERIEREELLKKATEMAERIASLQNIVAALTPGHSGGNP